MDPMEMHVIDPQEMKDNLGILVSNKSWEYLEELEHALLVILLTEATSYCTGPNPAYDLGFAQGQVQGIRRLQEERRKYLQYHSNKKNLN